MMNFINNETEGFYKKSNLCPKMFITTSSEDKKIYLWDEKVASTVFTYEDSNSKTTFNCLVCHNSNEFSEMIYASNYNKSLITTFSTSNPDPIYKSVPIEEPISYMTCNSDFLLIGSSKGNVFLFELINCNYLIQIKCFSSEVISLLLCKDNSIIAVSKDIIKIYGYDTILNKMNFYNNDNIKEKDKVNEFSSYVNNDKISDIITLLDDKYLCLIGKNKITIVNYPNLSNQIHNIFFDTNITKVVKRNSSELYISSENKVYFICLDKTLKNYENKLISEALNIDFHDKFDSISQQKSLLTVVVTDNYICNIQVGFQNLAVCFESGEIHLFNFFEYKLSNKYFQIKGNINNIISVNRPISQFGLNSNNTLFNRDLSKLDKKFNNSESTIFFDPYKDENQVFNEIIDNSLNYI